MNPPVHADPHLSITALFHAGSRFMAQLVFETTSLQGIYCWNHLGLWLFSQISVEMPHLRFQLQDVPTHTPLSFTLASSYDTHLSGPPPWWKFTTTKNGSGSCDCFIDCTRFNYMVQSWQWGMEEAEVQSALAQLRDWEEKHLLQHWCEHSWKCLPQPSILLHSRVC